MGFIEALLLAFIILKLTGVIAWSWWLVLAPLYFDVLLYGVILAVGGAAAFAFWRKHKAARAKFDEEWDSFDERWHLP
jgi:Transmembrane Fragile-X-F protein